MKKEEIIEKLVKLQILTIRFVERNTNLRCYTNRDIERVISGNKLTYTYLDAVNNLKSNVLKHCKNSNYLMEEVIKLEEAINNSDIKSLRLGIELQLKFTKEENELENYRFKRLFFMINGMVGIKEAESLLGIKETTIKQACQEERLLNTKKIGRAWLVHLPECRSYWDVVDKDETHLYKDYIY